MRWFLPVLPPLFALTLAPLMLGLINRTKAVIAGRRGPPLLQPYWDLAKYLRRGAVYGDVTTWVFRAGPVVTLAASIAAIPMIPFGGLTSPLSFSGDLVVLAGLFALGRFATVLAALDTGSSFEGMGASRELHFAALAEPAFLLALAVLARVDRRVDADRDLRRDHPGGLARRAAGPGAGGADPAGLGAGREQPDPG